MRAPLLVLFTDFGSNDLYAGQVKAVLAKGAPRALVIDALHDAPAFAVEPSAHLLSALVPQYPKGSVFVAVVDPGVGGKRDAIVVRADGRSLVGPDNGLFSILWRRAKQRRCWRVRWRPERLSSSFHGRDLFAPVAARLATRIPRGWLTSKERPDVLLDGRDLAEIVYIDHYGNAVTGLRSESVPRTATVMAGKKALRYARTFQEAPGLFWYRNSMDLVEVAANGGSAARLLGVRVGSRVSLR